ncbi:hypothetical protein ACJQWK_08675 [Exserohilum turcicum]|uniref:Uncharacterized protein n=1 Tax=Exserohilum turcicum (strain 28A) TaxID=671987 RepID=R0KIS0_EXST2|nr:uncharacterized protein SETTUDRAFT_160841 [Exserohilum turcica Et28A]EOA87937.1 hypothetical protein SETTUDRAFT_160841 [Exserohilum turcica Et28A]
MLSPAVLTLLVVASTARAAATPLLLSNPMTTRQMAPDVVASVDRYAAAACTGTICNVAGSGDLLVGCNVIRDGCRASLVLNYANNGCKVTAWADEKCKNTVEAVSLVTPGECKQIGAKAIKAVSVTC